MRRKRYQQGSLQKQGPNWVVKYRDAGGHRLQETLGRRSEMTRVRAEAKRAEVMVRVNSDNGILNDGSSNRITLGEHVLGNYIPFKEGRWKASTKTTTTDRIKRHIVGDLGEHRLGALDRDALQGFLDQKAGRLSRSMVDHLRFDLSAIFQMAIDDGLIERNPTMSLYTPRTLAQPEKLVMEAQQVEVALSALERRERLIVGLAVLTGLRPGEIFALRRRFVKQRYVEIVERVYQGELDTPKSGRSKRQAAVPSRLWKELIEWLDLIDSGPEAWVFPSEKGTSPLRPENLWRRRIGPRLEAVGLGWVNFQVLRRTHETIAHAQGVDPKIRADQVGHGVGIALNEYTATSIDQRLAAVQAVEDAVA